MDKRPRPLGWVSARRVWWRSSSPTSFLAPLWGGDPLLGGLSWSSRLLRDIEETHFLRGWKASSSGESRNLAAAPCRDARDVVPSEPSSLGIYVQERIAVPHTFSHIVGMLSLVSSTGPWSPALGKEVGRPHIFLESFFEERIGRFHGVGR